MEIKRAYALNGESARVEVISADGDYGKVRFIESMRGYTAGRVADWYLPLLTTEEI